MRSYFRRTASAALGVLTVAGCTIGPVDTTLISDTPANARSFAVAKAAVKTCYGKNARAKFLKAGFGYTQQPYRLRNGEPAERVIITSPDPSVYVLYSENRCHVGLENMTPRQSAELAQIWVKAFEAEPNSKSGDGLSDHVSGAWRRFFTEPARFPDKAPYYHRIYIAAYKTWPYGPYDPQRNLPYSIKGFFPKVPGAAVKLSHVTECHPQVSTGPGSGAWLPCSGPAYQPR